MLAVLSPAKTLDFDSPRATRKHSQPAFLDDARLLATKLAGFSEKRLAKLMDISADLAALNAGRFRSWHTPFTPANARAALLAFKGDVYTGFDCADWSAADFDAAQRRLRILSGLYGLLRPLDLIQPYRLEMGASLATRRGKNLYAFWGKRITAALNDALMATDSTVLVNLASQEYFRAVVPADLNARVVTPVFKDLHNGSYKVLGLFAKRARGLMANFIVRQRIDDPADLRAFAIAGYRFDPASSTADDLVFLRERPATG